MARCLSRHLVLWPKKLSLITIWLNYISANTSFNSIYQKPTSYWGRHRDERRSVVKLKKPDERCGVLICVTAIHEFMRHSSHKANDNFLYAGKALKFISIE